MLEKIVDQMGMKSTRPSALNGDEVWPSSSSSLSSENKNSGSKAMLVIHYNVIHE